MENLNSKVDLNKDKNGAESLEKSFSQGDNNFHTLGSDKSSMEEVPTCENEKLSVHDDSKRTQFVRQRTNTITTISLGTVIKGEVYCDDDIEINGVIEGDVTARRVEMSGKLNGNLECETAELKNSRVDGNIYSKGNVIVGDKSVVIGDIKAKNLTVGGNIKGNIDAEGYVHINKDACHIGEIAVKEIAVEDKANVVGNIKITTTSIDMTVFDNI